MSCNLKNEICGWKCTGFKGSKAWDAMQKAIKDNVDCEHCQSEGLSFLSAWRDMNNAGLGLKIFDLSNLKKWLKRIICINESIGGHELE